MLSAPLHTSHGGDPYGLPRRRVSRKRVELGRERQRGTEPCEPSHPEFQVHGESVFSTMRVLQGKSDFSSCVKTKKSQNTVEAEKAG